jgi:hypothetical protein
MRLRVDPQNEARGELKAWRTHREHAEEAAVSPRRSRPSHAQRGQRPVSASSLRPARTNLSRPVFSRRQGLVCHQVMSAERESARCVTGTFLHCSSAHVALRGSLWVHLGSAELHVKGDTERHPKVGDIPATGFEETSRSCSKLY